MFNNICGAPGEIAAGPSAPWPRSRSARPKGRPNRLRRFVELGFLSAGSSNSRLLIARAAEGSQAENLYGAPGEIRTPGLLVRSSPSQISGKNDSGMYLIFINFDRGMSVANRPRARQGTTEHYRVPRKPRNNRAVPNIAPMRPQKN